MWAATAAPIERVRTSQTTPIAESLCSGAAMQMVPEYRTLLGVDVVESASNHGYDLQVVPEAVEHMLSESLRNSGIDPNEVLEWEPTGDGALLTLASRHLGAVLDTTQRLDIAASARNRRHKPDVRLRIAVEVGPVGEGPGFFAPKIALNRILEAGEFKTLFRRCRREGPDDAVHSALIISDHALRVAFSGDHTRLLHRNDFGQLNIQNKEHNETTWIRVPNFDSRSITEFASEQQTQDRGSETPRPPEEREEPTYPSTQQVSNTIHGNSYGVQAGTINGNISQGTAQR
ncbi:hypothetical protein GCM10027563_45280 [Parasphingorhabdus pacifica]